MGRGRLQPGDPAIDFTLPDVASSTPRALSSWRGKSVVLLFYRGPWCGVCHQHLGQVQKRYPDIRDKGGEVVAVYPGKLVAKVDELSAICPTAGVDAPPSPLSSLQGS
jgi:peroxiredoxin